MKKLLFTACLFLGLTTVGFAQDRQHQSQTPEERAQKKTEFLSKKLTLSKEQAEKIYAINLEQAKKAEAFRESAQKEREKRLAERKSLMQENEDKINRVLNAEQKQSLEELKKQRMERFKERKNKAHRPQNREKGK